jgi:hypothetical protein
MVARALVKDPHALSPDSTSPVHGLFGELAQKPAPRGAATGRLGVDRPQEVIGQ